jgi:hypothetical protein
MLDVPFHILRDSELPGGSDVKFVAAKEYDWLLKPEAVRCCWFFSGSAIEQGDHAFRDGSLLYGVGAKGRRVSPFVGHGCGVQTVLYRPSMYCLQ